VQSPIYELVPPRLKFKTSLAKQDEKENQRSMRYIGEGIEDSLSGLVKDTDSSRKNLEVIYERRRSPTNSIEDELSRLGVL
jgi:hypothetical protein